MATIDLLQRRRQMMAASIDYKALFTTLVDGTITADIVVPDGVENIYYYAFYERPITSIVLPSSCKIVRTSAFNGCNKLENVTMPAVQRVERFAFNNCTKLENITFPASINYLDNQLLLGCTALQWCKVLATTPPTVNNNTFDATDTYPIFVPDGSVNAYKAATGWTIYAERIKPLSEIEN